MTILIPRALVLVLWLVFTFIIAQFLVTKSNTDPMRPERGTRRKVINFLAGVTAKLFLFCTGTKKNIIEKEDYDFSYYLGPNYK